MWFVRWIGGSLPSSRLLRGCASSIQKSCHSFRSAFCDRVEEVQAGIHLSDGLTEVGVPFVDKEVSNIYFLLLAIDDCTYALFSLSLFSVLVFGRVEILGSRVDGWWVRRGMLKIWRNEFGSRSCRTQKSIIYYFTQLQSTDSETVFCNSGDII
jgi:hypothetical protein